MSVYVVDPPIRAMFRSATLGRYISHAAYLALSGVFLIGAVILLGQSTLALAYEEKSDLTARLVRLTWFTLAVAVAASFAFFAMNGYLLTQPH